MILPKRLFGYKAEDIWIPGHLFKSAKRLFHDEMYEDSIAVLKLAIDSSIQKDSGGNTLFFEAIILYGWNLILSRDFEGFSEWRSNIHEYYWDIDEYPEFELMILWRDAMLGRNEDVIKKCSEYLAKPTLLLDPVLAGYLFIKGYAEFPLGQTKCAIEDCESSYSIYKILGKKIECGRCSNYLGMLNRANSDYREAQKWYKRSMEYYSQTKLRRKQSMVYLNIGVTHYKVGDYKAAFESLQKSLQLGLDGGWIHRQCFANIALGNVHRLTRDFEQARRHIHTAYNQAQELGFRREEALSLEFLGDVYRDEGRPAEARRFYKRALAIAVDIAPEGDIVMEVQRRMGECLTLEGDPAAASEYLTCALKMTRALGDRYEESVTLRIMAEANVALGDVRGAVKTISDSVALLSEIGARHELAVSLLRRGEFRLLQLEGKAGNSDFVARAAELDEAWEDATRALDLLLVVDVPYWTGKARNLAERVSRRKASLEKARQSARMAAADGRGKYSAPDVIIHTSGVMRDLIQICDMFAGSEDPILINGETGTGKELIARRIHQGSSRKDRPLVTVNVSAIAPTMFEREFFGHVKGSFSGADRDGEGFAASAHGGTLFLDEIGELPRDMQPKLLRLIQDGTYQAIGDPRVRRADIRLVAATNADLSTMVDKGAFRSDLYFRLKVLELNIPPVRERREDIVPLLRHFLGLAVGRPVDPAEYFNYAALSRLIDFDWPGNVREISMIARRAVMEMRVKGQTRMGLERDMATISMGQRLKAERARIMLALEECGGNRIEAARKLSMGRSTLYRRMEKLGIPTRKS